MQARILQAFLLLLLISCGQAHHEQYASEAQEYAVAEKAELNEAEGFISSSAAKINLDTSKRFIRTAGLKFRVKNVRKSTLIIEDITSEFSGYVSKTNLRSNKNRTSSTPVSKDSVLETIHYTVSNTMTLRIPQLSLDTVIRRIAKQIDYLDYRNITAEDVAISLLEKRKASQRLNSYQENVSDLIDNKSSKLKDAQKAEQSILNAQKLKDNALIEKLKLEDRIKYSTIDLYIYQREAFKRSLLVNEKNIEKFEPSLISEIGESLKTGWKMLKAIITTLFALWPLLLIAVIGIVLYRRFKQTK